MTLEPSDVWRLAAAVSWAVAAPYLWLIFAYLLAALRLRSWLWGRRALGWCQGLLILVVFRLFTGDTFFEPYPAENWRDFYLVFGTALAVIAAVPIYRLTRHFLEKAPGEGYWSSRDVVLFRAPIRELQGRAAVDLWIRYGLIGLLAVAIAGGVVWSIGHLRIGVEAPVFVGVALLCALGSAIYGYKGRSKRVPPPPAAADEKPSRKRR